MWEFDVFIHTIFCSDWWIALKNKRFWWLFTPRTNIYIKVTQRQIVKAIKHVHTAVTLYVRYKFCYYLMEPEYAQFEYWRWFTLIYCTTSKYKETITITKKKDGGMSILRWSFAKGRTNRALNNLSLIKRRRGLSPSLDRYKGGPSFYSTVSSKSHLINSPPNILNK